MTGDAAVVVNVHRFLNGFQVYQGWDRLLGVAAVRAHNLMRL